MAWIAGNAARADDHGVAGFWGLGDLPGGQQASFALAISADGRVVAGNSNSAAGTEAFRWQDGVMSPLGGLDPQSVFSIAHALSHDGSVIVGSSTSRRSTQAFQQSGASLAMLPGMPDTVTFSESWDVSDDGSVIVGAAEIEGAKRAFVWHAGGVQWIQGPPNGPSPIAALSVSANGSVAAGNMQSPQRMQGFIWRTGAFKGLGGLPGGNGGSTARAISADGHVVVGSSPSLWGFEAFRWENGTMTGLGALSDHHELFSIASDVSADGSIVVGSSEAESGATEAFIWDAAHGMRNLRDVLVNEHHLDLAGWTLSDATGISADGLSVVGFGKNPDGKPEGWLARLPGRSVASGQPGAVLAYRSTIDGLADANAVAIRSDGIIFIAATGESAVRLFGPDGSALGTWTQTGGTSRVLNRPEGIACGADGSVIVADTGNHRIVIFADDGMFTGEMGGFGAEDGQMIRPAAVATNGTLIVVTDTGNDRVAVFDPSGKFIRSWGGTGEGPGQFRMPRGIAIDHDGTICVADSGNDRIQQFKPDGTFIRAWGQRGRNAGSFIEPRGLALLTNRLLVIDTGNHRVQVFNADGSLLNMVGTRAMRPHESHGLLHFPSALAISPSGRAAAIAEAGESRCQLFDCDPQTLLADGTNRLPAPPPSRSYFGEVMDVQGRILAVAVPDRDQVELYDLTTANPQLIAAIGGHGSRFGQFIGIAGIALDAQRHRLYVSDAGNRRVQAFELAPDFDKGPNPPPPGAPARARFSSAIDCSAWAASLPPHALDVQPRPGAMRIDAQGDVLVADRGNRMIIALDARRLSPIRTIGNRGSESQLLDPIDIAIDPSDQSIHVADISRGAVVTYESDGTFRGALSMGGAAHPQSAPCSLHIGTDGRTYVVDHSHCVQVFDREGKGLVSWGPPGIGTGELFKPRAIAEDDRGRLVVLDWGNHRVQWFSPLGASLGVFGEPLFLRPAQLNPE